MTAPLVDLVTQMRAIANGRSSHRGYGRDTSPITNILTRAASALESTSRALTEKEAELAEVRTERDREKLRGDNHWETLRGIRDIARTSGDLERIIQWVNDAGSGYVERPETTIAALMDQVSEATRERDEALAALRALEDHCKEQAGFAASEQAHFGIDNDPFTQRMKGIRSAYLDVSKRLRIALADAAQKDPGTEQREAGV